MLTFTLKQNHGGWNSDDNQNNNLGRFRLSVTDGAERRRPTRCRSACARSWRSRASKRTPAQIAAVFSYWRTTVPEWKEANDADRGAVEAASRRARRSWCCRPRDEPRDDARAQARRLPQAGQAGRRPACRRSCTRCRPNAPPTRLTFAQLAGRPQVADDRPRRSSTASGRRTSAPASSPRSEDFGIAERAARRIPNCSTGWPSSSWTSGWSLKTLHRLIVTSATYRQSSQVTPELLRTRPVQPPAGPRPAVPRRGRDRPRHRAGGQRPAESEDRRPERLCRRRRRSCSSRRPATARSPGTRTTGPDRYRRALYTFRRRSTPYPCCRPSTRPTATSPASAARARTRRCRR